MNDDMLNDNALDRWLRDNAGDHREPPAPDGWDTPREAVWTRLRSSLDRRKRRRRAAFLWLVLLAGLFGGATALWYQKVGKFIPASEKHARIAARAETLAGHPATPSRPEHKNNGKQTLPAVLSPGPAINTKTVAVPATSVVEDVPETVSSPPPTERPIDIDTAPLQTAPAAADCTLTPAPAVLASPPVELVPLPLAELQWQQKPELPAAGIRPRREKNRLYAGPVEGAFFTSRVLQAPDGNAPNGRESGAWTLQYGAAAGLRLGRHWSVESGLQWSAVRLQAQRTVDFRYRTDREQYNAQRFVYQNSDDQSVQTSFGEVDMRMDIEREPNRPILDQALVRLTLLTDEQVRYVRLPLLLRRQQGAGRWQWSLAAGLGFNFESGYDLRLTAARTNRLGVRRISARLQQQRAEGLAPFYLDAQFGLGLQYRLAPQWRLRLAPEFRYGLGSMYQNGPFRSLALSGGVQVGMLWGL
jgi:hypothetical protein